MMPRTALAATTALALLAFAANSLLCRFALIGGGTDAASFTAIRLGAGALVLAVAGLALLGTMAAGLSVAVKDEQHREAAVLTFLVTLSGVTVAGVGSAFWGVVVGGLAQWLWTRRQAASH